MACARLELIMTNIEDTVLGYYNCSSQKVLKIPDKEFR